MVNPKEKKRSQRKNARLNQRWGNAANSKTHVPFHVEAKVDIKPYVGEVDAIKLNQWLQQMEVYFSVHEVT
jgi:hypothetical protein